MTTPKRSADEVSRESLRLAHPLSEWHQHQGQSNDCGPYCAAMIINTLRNAQMVDGTLLGQELSHWRRFLLPARISGWATFPWGVVWALEREGLHARWRVFQSRARLYKNLREGISTIVIVGEPLRFSKQRRWQGWSHYKILYSWDPEKGWGFVDPAVPSSPGVSWQKDTAFWSHWRGMGRQIIEVTS